MGRKRSVISLILYVLVGFICLSSIPSGGMCDSCIAREHNLRNEIRAIDKALEELHYQWLRHRARALWHADRGLRLQNKKGFYLEARRSYKEAQFEWEVVEMIEQRMRVLQQKRSLLGGQRG